MHKHRVRSESRDPLQLRGLTMTTEWGLACTQRGLCTDNQTSRHGRSTCSAGDLHVRNCRQPIYQPFGSSFIERKLPHLLRENTDGYLETEASGHALLPHMWCVSGSYGQDHVVSWGNGATRVSRPSDVIPSPWCRAMRCMGPLKPHLNENRAFRYGSNNWSSIYSLIGYCIWLVPPLWPNLPRSYAVAGPGEQGGVNWLVDRGEAPQQLPPRLFRVGGRIFIHVARWQALEGTPTERLWRCLFEP